MTIKVLKRCEVAHKYQRITYTCENCRSLLELGLEDSIGNYPNKYTQDAMVLFTCPVCDNSITINIFRFIK